MRYFAGLLLPTLSVSANAAAQSKILPGSAARGERVLLDITLMSAVWRHGPAMAESMRRNAISWPHFQGSEMADLIAYLNSPE